MRTPNMIRAWTALAIAVGLLLIGGVAVAGRPASAGPPQDNPGLEKVRALRERLPDAALTHSVALGNGITRHDYALKADRIQQLRSSWRADADEQKRIDHHTEMLMRQGHSVAASAVDVVPFEVPGQLKVYLVQSKTDVLDDLVVQVTEQAGNDGFMGISLGTVSTDLGDEIAGTDAGFDAGEQNSWVTNRGRGARTRYFNPDYSSDYDHWFTDNWEKFQNTKSGYQRSWAYNRYTTFDAANGKWGDRGELIDATIRARPHKNYKSRVSGGPYDYTPRPQEDCNHLADAKINVGPYGELTVPIVSCYSGQEIYPNGGEHSMGTAWYGTTTAQRYLDMAFEFTAASTSYTPIYSDYVWMSVRYCYKGSGSVGGCVPWAPKEHNKWTDGGW